MPRLLSVALIAMLTAGCVSVSTGPDQAEVDAGACHLPPDPVPCMMVGASLMARARFVVDHCETMDATEVTIAAYELANWADQYNYCVSQWRYDASNIDLGE